ncbi:hypothetical protein [uncultured Shimia sp.]|uniref:hypothetical protein n=1 Tax=uncultured Shimia sp. TaxID=573152 RepID=UPI00263948FB|nr:hypothetical protein [uncultured Shimia sp.]
MKTFKELMAEPEQLDERVLRSGTIAALAAKSAAAGTKAEKSFKQAQAALDDNQRRDDVHTQLDAINAALRALIDAHRHQTRQIRHHMAMDAAGHLSKKTKR